MMTIIMMTTMYQRDGTRRVVIMMTIMMTMVTMIYQRRDAESRVLVLYRNEFEI